MRNAFHDFHPLRIPDAHTSFSAAANRILCLKLGHDRFLAHCAQSIIHNHPEVYHSTVAVDKVSLTNE
jgi:hypothetical protein